MTHARYGTPFTRRTLQRSCCFCALAHGPTAVAGRTAALFVSASTTSERLVAAGPTYVQTAPPAGK